jgi:2',3'-cyclic-nucleotide 2'-phosphodiesterase (5'-nucleotidase family)
MKSFLIFIVMFMLSNTILAQTDMLKPLSGKIEEIDIQKNNLILVTAEDEEKQVFIDSKTTFVKNMVKAKFEDFKAGEQIVVSTKDSGKYEIKADGLFDAESAFLLTTGQGTEVEYEGKILEINNNIINASTQYGRKKFSITPELKAMKNLKDVSIADFSVNDEFYATVIFPGTEKHEPPLLNPLSFYDPLSYVNNLLTAKHGPMIVRGKVNEVTEKKLTFKIGEQEILANKNTVMLVAPGFKTMSDLKGKSVMVYGIIYPTQGKTAVASAVLQEEALPSVRASLARSNTGTGDNISVLTRGKIVEIRGETKSILIEKDKSKKQLLLNLSSCNIIDDKDPERKDLTVDYLRTGDYVEVQGYVSGIITTLHIEKKSDVSDRNEAKVNIYYFTDLFGYLNPYELGGSEVYSFLTKEELKTPPETVKAGGFSYLSYKYKNITGKTKNNLLLCGGNFLHGTPLAESTGGESVIDCLNIAGVSASVLGEEDFMTGKENLVKLIGRAKFPVLGANVLLQGTDNLLPGLKPYAVIPFEGVKVGIIGFVNPDIPSLVSKTSLDGIAIRDLKGTLLNYYSKVEAEADVIIIMTNQKFADNILLANDFQNILPGARKKPCLLFCGGGQAFSVTEEPFKADNILLLEGGTKGRFLSEMKLGFQKKFTKMNYVYNLHLISPSLVKKEDEQIRKLIDGFEKTVPSKYSEILGKAGRIIHITKRKYTVSPMGYLVTEAMLKKSGADAAFYENSHLRKYLFKGDISYGELYNVIPYDFNMVVLELTGKQIREIVEQSLINGYILQFSGMNITYKRNNPDGKKIKTITINGKALSDSTVYKIATTGFLAGGGENYSTFTKGKILSEGDIVRDIVADYIRNIKEVNDQPERRIFPE